MQQQIQEKWNRGFKKGLSYVAKLTQEPELTDTLYGDISLFKDENLDFGQNVLTRELTVQGMKIGDGKIPKGSILLAVPYIVYT